MSRYRTVKCDIVVTVFVLSLTFLVNLVLQRIFTTQSFSSEVFILGVFLISLGTKGYLWGILASLLSVLAENFAFTFPYFAFDFLFLVSSLIVVI